MSDTPILFIARDLGATIPTRGSELSAGLDLSANLLNEEGFRAQAFIGPGKRLAIPTGIHVGIPVGYYGRVAPRSGLAFKNGIDVLAGVIDADYTGEIKVILLNTSQHQVTIGHEDRIAQLIIEKIAMPEIVLIDDLNETTRGANGFGSTG